MSGGGQRPLLQRIPVATKEVPVTPEQEKQLQHIETELAIASKKLRLVQLRKEIAKTELDTQAVMLRLTQFIETADRENIHMRNQRIINFVTGAIELADYERQHLHECTVCQTMCDTVMRVV